MSTCLTHMRGVWLADAGVLERTRRAVVGGVMPIRTRVSLSDDDRKPIVANAQSGAHWSWTVTAERNPYGDPVELFRVYGGLAVVPIHGMMMRGDASFDGACNTIRVRRAVALIMANAEVKSVIVDVDSPGGTHAGCVSLANSLEALAKSKRVVAITQGMCCSAAYWAAAACGRILATRDAMVGSIGSIAVMEDTSGKAEAEGIRVHAITDAELKAYVDGVPLSEAILESERKLVLDASELFRKEASRLRGGKPTPEQLKELKGEAMATPAAIAAGLVDDVAELDALVDSELRVIQAGNAKTGQSRGARSSLARAKLAALRTDARRRPPR